MVVDLVRQRGTILLSFAILAELFEVLSRKQFRCYLDEGDVRRFLAALTREAQWIDVHVEITACRDPKDDKFLSLAVSGRATHIVTGDADLLALHPFQGIQIPRFLRPARFWSNLSSQDRCCGYIVPRPTNAKPGDRNLVTECLSGKRRSLRLPFQRSRGRPRYERFSRQAAATLRSSLLKGIAREGTL
jgi:putative PIN family toxin of toxin-antitoxin system